MDSKEHEPERLAAFMAGMHAAAELFARAAKSGFCVEVIILGAALVDASLRIGLILNAQLQSGSTAIDNSLLSHGTSSKLSERDVFRRAAKESVVDADLLRELEELYDARNRVVHRYIITDISTDDAMRIAMRYEAVIPLVGACIGRLEQSQAERGVGMATTVGPLDVVDQLEHDSRVAAKHGKWWLARIIRRHDR